LKTTGHFKIWSSECTNKTHFPIERDTEGGIQNIFTTLKGNDRHKNKNKTHTSL